MQFKGPRFKSYDNNGPSGRTSGIASSHRALPEGRAWAGFSGKKERIRNMKKVLHHILKSKVQGIQDAIARALQTVNYVELREREYAHLYIMFAAYRVSEEANVDWDIVMNYHIDQYEEKTAAEKAAVKLESKGIVENIKNESI